LFDRLVIEKGLNSVLARGLLSKTNDKKLRKLIQGLVNEKYLLSASCGLLLLTVGPSPVLKLRPLQQDTTGHQRRWNLSEKCGKEDRQRGKEETKNVVDGSDAPKKPETTPKQDIKSGIIDERRNEENRLCHKEGNQESCEQVRRENR
jgi:hypothetical protein